MISINANENFQINVNSEVWLISVKSFNHINSEQGEMTRKPPFVAAQLRPEHDGKKVA